MPLQILLPLVVGGIAAIAVILHLLGLSRPRRFDGVDDAMRAWRREQPDRPPTGAYLAGDGRAALITLDAGTGLVWCHGADTVARPLGGARITETAQGLRINLPDFAAPEVRCRLAREDREIWKKLLEAA